jgi:Zn finger protein HypA/HybF involved in hydrogenase expression
MEMPESITCVECGSPAGRLTPLPEETGFQAGDVVAFICPECGARFDLVVEDDEAEPA